MAATYLDSGGAQEVTLQDLYNQIGFLLEKLEYGLITDSAKRLKVNVEAGTLPAVTTVTTVNTVAIIPDRD